MGTPRLLAPGPWHSHPAAHRWATSAWPGVTPVSPRTAQGCPSTPLCADGGSDHSSPRRLRGCPHTVPMHDPHHPFAASTAWCSQLQIVLNSADFEENACGSPPCPNLLAPTMCSRVAGGGRKKFHATQEATRPRPNPQHRAPPSAPEPTRGPLTLHRVPPQPQSRRLPRATHLWAQRERNTAQTTMQPSPPRRVPSESGGRKTPKSTRNTQKNLKKGAEWGNQEGNAAHPSSPTPAQPALALL